MDEFKDQISEDVLNTLTMEENQLVLLSFYYLIHISFLLTKILTIFVRRKEFDKITVRFVIYFDDGGLGKFTM